MTRQSTREKEKRIIELKSMGYCNKEIADLMGRTPAFVEQRLANLMKEFSAKNSTHLVVIAIREGLIKV